MFETKHIAAKSLVQSLTILIAQGQLKRIFRLYLNWQEEPERDEMYLKFMKTCSPSVIPAAVAKRKLEAWKNQDLGCQGVESEDCLNPAADFDTYCRGPGMLPVFNFC